MSQASKKSLSLKQLGRTLTTVCALLGIAAYLFLRFWGLIIVVLK